MKLQASSKSRHKHNERDIVLLCTKINFNKSLWLQRLNPIYEKNLQTNLRRHDTDINTRVMQNKTTFGAAKLHFIEFQKSCGQLLFLSW